MGQVNGDNLVVGIHGSLGVKQVKAFSDTARAWQGSPAGCPNCPWS